MASTYENDLRLEEMATGENSGSWGTKTNTNLELIADAFSYGTETIANADTTITIADGAADAARSLALKINSSADLTTTRTITLAPNTTSKVWIIENNTSGGQTLTISAGSGTNITLLNGQTKIIATDGIGAGSNVVELTQDIAIADLFIDDDLSMQSDGAIINFGADDDITLTHAADTSLTLGGSGSTTGLVVNNTATDGDPILGFALSGTNTFTMGVDDGDSDKFKIGTTAIGTNTRLTIDSTGDVEINQGNFTVTSIGTGAASGPYLNLSRNSSSPADDDAIGIIQFNGKNDQDESLAYVQIQTNILDATDATEDGYFRVNVRANGSLEDSLTISHSNIIFNDSSLDRDFRVESDNLTHALFVDAGTDRVSVGSSSPTTRFYVSNTNPGDNKTAARITGGTSYVSDGNWEGPLQLDWAQSSNDGYIRMLNIDLTDSGSGNQTNYGIYVNGEDENFFSSNLDVRGSARFNENGGDNDFRVESDSNANMLFVDAGNNRVGIGAAPSNPFEVNAGSGNAFIYTTGVTALVAQADGAGDTLILQTTDTSATNGPNIKFRRVATGADNDGLMQLGVNGFNDTGTEEIQFFRQRHFIIDASDGTEDGAFDMFNMKGGTLRSVINHDSVTTIFNDNSVDIDFRVESDSNTHMLFVDAGNNRVGIASSSPDDILTVGGETLTYANALDGHTLGIRGGVLGGTAGDEKDIAYFAVESTNNNTLGLSLKAYRKSTGNDWTSAGFKYTLNVDNTDSVYDNLLVFQGSKIGIHTDEPAGVLHIDSDSASGATYGIVQNDGTANTNTIAGWVIRDGTTVMGGVRRRRDGSGSPIEVGNFASDATVDLLQNNERRITFDTSSNIVVNEPGIDADFRVESDTSAYGLYLDAGHGGVGINDAGSASYQLTVLTGAMKSFGLMGRNTDASNRAGLVFYSQSQAAIVGQIQLSNSATTYVTSSDYRLKENVIDMTGAIDRLMQLRPKRFSWICEHDDGPNVDGFLAHEVQSIVPSAVSGEKDAVDDKGNPEYQGVDHSKLVPVLTAALQEAITKIETLEARITALENA